VSKTQQEAARLDVNACGRVASEERLFDIAEIDAGEIGAVPLTAFFRA